MSARPGRGGPLGAIFAVAFLVIVGTFFAWLVACNTRENPYKGDYIDFITFKSKYHAKR